MARRALYLSLLLATHTVVSHAQAALHATPGSVSTATAAVEVMVRALKARDVDMVGSIWGTRDWLVRDHDSRDEFVKRVKIMTCFFINSDVEIVRDDPESTDHRRVTIKVRRPEGTATTTATAVQRSDGSWLVESIDIAHLSPNCHN